KANPTGLVSFSVSNGDGTFGPVACTLAPVPATSDKSSCTTTYTPTGLGTGSHSLKATYGGDTYPIQFASSDGTFTLAINSPPTDLAVSPSSVQENQPIGTTVGTFSTTDPNAGNTFTYTLVSGTGSADNGSFTINGGVLKTAAVFDYETRSSYSIRVRTTDQGGLTFEKALTITILDVNENSAPATTTPTFSPASPKTADLLQASTTTSDPDGDFVSV